MSKLVKAQSNELQVLSKEELRKQMKSALKEIDAQLTKLYKGSSITYKISNAFKMNENDGNSINIQNHVDVCYLLKAFGLMKRVLADYEQNVKELELTKYPVCTWMGYPVEGWIHDLKLRIGIVTNADMIANLTQAKTKLESHLSEEDRLSSTLKEIGSLLNK